MKRRHILTAAIWIAMPVLALVLALHSSRWGSRVIVQAQSKAIPVTITYQTTMTNVVTGKVETDAPFIKAYRGNGDVAHTSVAPGHLRELELRSQGITVAIRGNLKSTLGNGIPYREADPGDQCENVVGITSATQNVLGFDLLKRAQSGTANTPTGVEQIESDEQWLAPVLGCRPLLISQSWFTNGVVSSTTVTKALNVVQGEPDASLFAIAPDAQEVSPSAFFAANNVPFQQRAEDAYQKQKAAREAKGLP